MANDMQVDVRMIEKESYGAAMLYFTGSKEHNVSLRSRALKMGYTLNEYALSTVKGEKRVGGASEEEIYAKLKLDFIPPELRENSGEIDAAESHALPALIELRDIRGDLQMHTVASDGKNSIEEMGEAARALGLRVHRNHGPFQGGDRCQWHGREAHFGTGCQNPRSQCACEEAFDCSPESKWIS